MAQIALFKELIKQVSCEAIPNVGFSREDLDKVKACAKKVTPTETIDFNPNITPDQDQVNQTDCIADATDKAKKIITAEQRKLPNAIKYLALRSKVQELLDNLTPIHAYFKERYDFFNSVIEKVQPYTAEFLYWSEEFNRLSGAIETAKANAEEAHKNQITRLRLITLLYEKSKDSKILSKSTRDALLSLTPDFANIYTVSQSLGEDTATSNAYSNLKTSLAASTTIAALVAAVQGKAIAYSSRELSKDNAIRSQSEKISSIPALPEPTTVVETLINNQIKSISHQLTAKFETYSTTGKPVVPARTAGFTFNLIDKSQTLVKVTQFNSNDEPVLDSNHNAVQVEEAVKIYGSPVLQSNLFEDVQGFAINGISLWREGQYNPSPPEDSDYSVISGLLYNGVSGNSYLGLYKKLSKPIKYLFTLEERGLTLNGDLIDPLLAGVKDAPVSIKEDETTYFIKNQAAYESFYESLAVKYPDRAKAERDTVYPGKISAALTELRSIARREAADFFRRDPDSPLKLVRPESYTTSPGSQVFTQGTFTYSNTDSALSSKNVYYTNSYESIKTLMEKCKSELARLDQLVKENSMDENMLREKLLAIPCFSKAGAATQSSNLVKDPEDPLNANASSGQEPCAQKTAKKRATDPLTIRTLSGTDTSLPDLTSQCYWKEFAKSLNKVCLLPIPDISGLPATANLGFRYWPINCVIPTPFGIVLLPIPPIWKSLFVLPTPLGTLVCFLTMPIAPIGIPIPSIYLFFFAIDGNKYLAFAPNVPILYAPPSNLKFGFVQDNSAKSANPLGITPGNPYKGQPIKGALTAPLAINALTAKARRLAELSSMIASGKPYITNLSGEKLPVNLKLTDLLNSMPSEAESMLAMVSAKPSGDFGRQMEQFKKTINRQLDKLGDMQIGPIQNLKQQLAKKRELEEAKAFSETEPSSRRLKRQAARNIKLTNLQDKINATTQVMHAHLDNIKLGTIKYPKDPTKFNPELPAAITAIFDIIELAATGDLKIESSAKDLRVQLSRVISKINVKDLSNKKKFDLKNPQDFAQFKGALKKLTSKTTSYLKGGDFKPNTSAAKTQEEADEIAASEKAIQDKLAKAISLTAAALATPISLNIFDFGKKCCEVQAQNVLSTVPIPVNLAFTLITALLESLIDALTPNAIIKSLGLSSNIVDISQIGTMLDTMINSIPKVTLPDPASLQILVLALVVPVLSIISLPKAPVPLHLPTIPLIIPLDPILKPLIKKALGAVVEGAFKLLDQAGNAVLAAEIDAKAEAEAQAAKAKAQVGSQDGTTGTSGAAYSTLPPNPQIADNSDPAVKVVTKAFKTACGDSGITASLTLESRIELNRVINTVKNLNADTPNLAEKITETYEATSNSRAILSVELPSGEVFSLPELPFVALDIGGNFDLLTGADVIELIRSIINSIFDKLIKPITKIIEIISLLSLSLNTFSYTTIEAGIPYVNIIKLILIGIDAIIPPGFKIKAANLEAMKIVQDVAIAAIEKAEPVLKEVLWLGSVVACAFGSAANAYLPVTIARLLHPIMNQDDLPPWERLTHKNPLFAIFLDEIAWRGSLYSTGSLIFQTKTPAVLPYTPIFPIVHIPAHTLSP